jgi:hypothetical protein
MTREKSLETMLTIVVGAGILFLFFKLKLILIIGLILGGVGLLMPGLSKKISWLWYKLAEALGFVVSKVLLSLIFFVFLLPLGLLSRMFRKDLLQLPKKAEGSYFQVRNLVFSPKEIKNPW